MNKLGIDCPRCKVTSELQSTSKWRKRTNSRVIHAFCKNCKHNFFLKQPISQELEPSEAEREYRTLQQVHEHFPLDSKFKVASPVEYIASTHTIIMDYEKGVGFLSAISKADKTESCDLVAKAGHWLRMLHDSRKVDAREAHTVATATQRLSQSRDYWEKNHPPPDGTSRVAIKLLTEIVPKLDEMMNQRVWVHGDFTPDNILVSGQALIGLDVAWRSRANPVMDLAPFLNHLCLALTSAFGFRLHQNIADLEQAFMGGYTKNSSTEQHILLLWYRLYFLIRYRYTSREFGIASRFITQAQLKPQIAKLTEDLGLMARKLQKGARG